MLILFRVQCLLDFVKGVNIFAEDDEVVELLYRKNKVPVWIDINVLKSNRKTTTFNLLCAGRYTNNKEEFYYNINGSGPFGIKSPNLPINYQEGKRFRL